MNMCNRRRLLRQKAGGACLYMPQDGHWKPVLKSPPPPQIGSSAAKKMEIANSPLKTVVSDPKFQAKMAFFRRKFCHAVFDSREQQAIPPD